ITHRLEFVPDGDFYRYALTKINRVGSADRAGGGVNVLSGQRFDACRHETASFFQIKSAIIHKAAVL
ncbi:hypothetical protein, partial [Klebsiella oxytoca]|uniref:hypothetical protein n=1 Tax=Klebsiella oxytoca TaxID=571 RepID=UPI001C1F63CD